MLAATNSVVYPEIIVLGIALAVLANASQA